MFETLINSKYQLFMSATVSKPLLTTTLGLNSDETKFIQLEPTFPKENKKIIFHGIEKLNYENMKKPDVVNRLGEVSSKIAQRHFEKGESGIILAPSFVVTKQIASQIKSGRVFEHQSGQKLKDVLEYFRACKEPAVLISPSLWEGISLDGDDSRFQIFVKCPYASLADKRTQYVANYHRDLYTLGTILKLVQGAGRSVRSPEDWATTYMLDQQINYVWKNALNVWGHEFDVSYQRFM
jgi:Rad3-related DNA helicase